MEEKILKKPRPIAIRHIIIIVLTISDNIKLTKIREPSIKNCSNVTHHEKQTFF